MRGRIMNFYPLLTSKWWLDYGSNSFYFLFFYPLHNVVVILSLLLWIQDEWSGEQKLRYSDVVETIEPESIRPMGNYAVAINWPDGFSQVNFNPWMPIESSLWKVVVNCSNFHTIFLSSKIHFGQLPKWYISSPKDIVPLVHQLRINRTLWKLKTFSNILTNVVISFNNVDHDFFFLLVYKVGVSN